MQNALIDDLPAEQRQTVQQVERADQLVVQQRLLRAGGGLGLFAFGGWLVTVEFILAGEAVAQPSLGTVRLLDGLDGIVGKSIEADVRNGS